MWSGTAWGWSLWRTSLPGELGLTRGVLCCSWDRSDDCLPSIPSTHCSVLASVGAGGGGGGGSFRGTVGASSSLVMGADGGVGGAVGEVI